MHTALGESLMIKTRPCAMIPYLKLLVATHIQTGNMHNAIYVVMFCSTKVYQFGNRLPNLKLSY